MVYSADILNLFDTSTASTLSAPSDPVVKVLYNGSGVLKGQPTPFVELSTSVERNSLGMAMAYVNKITLNGTIASRGSSNGINATGTPSGITAVTSGINDLYKIFKSGDAGVLQIQCKSDTNNLLAWTGVKVLSIDVTKTNNNWVFTADYTVSLEYLEPALSGFFVKSITDSWNIEPLEDYFYTSTKTTVLEQQQTISNDDNPNLKNLGQSGGQTGSNDANGTAKTTEQQDISIVGIPQVKISRTVGAVGIPSGSGMGSFNFAYLNAKRWVDHRLSLTFNPINDTNNSGLINFTNGTSLTDSTIKNLLNGGGYLYNHLRTTNFNITEGSYEVTDTFLAMPTGLGYTEEYSIDMSSDDRYIHTVRVQGEIRGLSMSPLSVLSGATGYVVSGQNPGGIYANINLAPSTGQLEMTNFSHSIPDAMSTDGQATNNTSIVNKFYRNKYDNAASGWLFDIKPYLYRRACIAMNSADRKQGYINSTVQPPKPPTNPAYSLHGVLNKIPVSTSETHNPRKGTISYSYEFNNKFTRITGVLYENISIEDTGPTDVIAEAFVLGRALGPVLQNLNSKTASRKQVSIEVGVVPPSSIKGFFMQQNECPLFTGGHVYQAITGIIEGFKPFGDRDASIFGNVKGFSPRTAIAGQVYVASDSQSWNPNEGRFSRTVSWIYQQCTNDKHYLDH